MRGEEWLLMTRGPSWIESLESHGEGAWHVKEMLVLLQWPRREEILSEVPAGPLVKGVQSGYLAKRKRKRERTAIGSRYWADTGTCVYRT